MQRIARVFPRVTKATPQDELCFFDEYPPLLAFPEVDEIHVSVTYTYDMPKAEQMAENYKQVGVSVKIDGPAYGKPAGEFIPGMYLKHGYTITSRGCPNRCWFCEVPNRQGTHLELDIKDGWNILDDNLLAASEDHIRKVFEMLKRQPQKPEFTGGLEAKLLKTWHVDLLREVKTKRMYFAYDTPDDYEPLVEAGKLLQDGGFKMSSHKAGAYVLIGYKGDTFEKAEERLKDTLRAGFVPYAMLYKDKDGNEDKTWRQFQRLWLRPTIVYMRNKDLFKVG